MDKFIRYKTRKGQSGIYRLLIATGWFLLLVAEGCHQQLPQARILFTGDILLARNVQVEMEQKKISPWAHMGNLFHDANLVIGNFEGAVGDGIADTMSPSTSPVFNVQGKYIKFLSEAGFTALSVENNHSFDMGDSGKINTIGALLSNGLTPLNYNNSPRFFHVNGITVAVIAVNLVPGRNMQHQQIPSVEILQKLRLAKSLSNMVVVFIHWGSELLEWPSHDQRQCAEFLVSHGADLIIGCHPHVIQAPEMVLGKPVFFSLGNHLFDQKYEDTKEGLMVDCKISGGYFTCSGIITHASKNSFFPEITGDKVYKLDQVKLHDAIKIAGVTLSAESIDTGDYGLKLQGYRDGKKIWQTQPMHILSLQKSKLDGQREYLVALEKHYSNMDDENGVRPYVYSVEQDGLVSRWRGSALAWPLLDAELLPGKEQVLCGLHRGDSFIQLNPKNSNTRVLPYQWNGFGFNAVEDSAICKKCKELYGK